MDHSKNRFTWMYRIRPSVCHTPFTSSASMSCFGKDVRMSVNPNQLRWRPLASTALSDRSFVNGLRTMCSHGAPEAKDGLAIHVYSCSRSMTKQPKKEVMVDADGDMLIVPQNGSLIVRTELGTLFVEPCEIVVIPRGFRFAIDLVTEGQNISGYILEVFKGHFELPSLGAIGANGLANKRDFLYPSASYEVFYCRISSCCLFIPRTSPSYSI